MLNNSTFKINTSDTVKCISSSEDGNKIAFGDNSGTIHLANNKGDIIWEKNLKLLNVKLPKRGRKRCALDYLYQNPLYQFHNLRLL